MEIKNEYFKFTFEEGRKGISGLALPDPKRQPYHFINCEIHPRIWSCMKQIYTKSSFINTYTGPS